MFFLFGLIYTIFEGHNKNCDISDSLSYITSLVKTFGVVPVKIPPKNSLKW